MNKKECQLRYRESHREILAEKARLWRKNNPDKVQRTNDSRLFAGVTYLGKVGFTDSEIREMLDGTAQ